MKWTFKLGKIVTFYAYPLGGMTFSDTAEVKGQVIRNSLVQDRAGEAEYATVRWHYPEGEFEECDVHVAELRAVDDGLEDGA